MAAEIEALAGFDEVLLIRPKRLADSRGYFCETFRETDLQKYGVQVTWVQENESLSLRKGTIRGLHFQTAPHQQAKLVRCLGGALLDVVVDIRRESPTFGRHASIELTADSGLQVYVPAGFAHGFCTLTDDCRVLYRTSDYYAPSCDAGIAHDDPDLAIDWPVASNARTLSDRDRALPKLRDVAGLLAEGAGDR